MGLNKVLKSVWKSGEAQVFFSKRYKDNRLDTFFENYVYKITDDYVVAVFRDVKEEEIKREQLRTKITEIEKLNKAMIDRELKMIELKQEIKNLKQSCGS